MDVPAIAKIAFTSEDRVCEVIHNFNDDGFDSLDAKYAGGRPPKFTLPQRQQIKTIALARPTDHDLPFSTWSLSKLAEFVVAEGVVDDISHEGLRALLREEGVSFQRLKTFKVSNDPNYEATQEPGPRALRHRRRLFAAGTWRPDRGDLLRRVRAAQPATPPRPPVGDRSPPAAARQPHHDGDAGGPPTPARRGPSSAGCLRLVDRPALRARHRAQGPADVQGVPALHPPAVPARRAHRDRVGQLLAARSTRDIASGTGPQRTTSSSPSCRSTHHG